MNNDDESFLSAYVDGELNPDQQQRLESALVANPHLAEKLRGLTQVRDLVAGLPHDGSVDVTARVMQQIHARSRRGFLPTLEGWRRGSRRILPLAGLAASAASLMVAASLAILMQTSQFDRSGQLVSPIARRETVIQSNPTVSSTPAEVRAKPIAPVAVPSSSHSDLGPVPANGLVTASSVSPIAPDRAVADLRQISPNGDAEHVRQFLDNPNLKRFFWVRNGPRNDSAQVVASIVERTTHFDFFKITVARGIVIDPRHPEEATVLAFVVNPNQLERFNDQLKEALPGLVNHEALDPVVATQLADIERVRSFPPAALAEVEIPREALALQTRPGVGNDRIHGDQDGATAPKDADRTGTAIKQENVVVLVWVANPSAR